MKMNQWHMKTWQIINRIGLILLLLSAVANFWAAFHNGFDGFRLFNFLTAISNVVVMGFLGWVMWNGKNRV